MGWRDLAAVLYFAAMRALRFSFTLLTVLSLGCDSSPPSPPAPSTAPPSRDPAPPEEAPRAAPSGRSTFDQTTSRIAWEGRKVTASETGSFGVFQGIIALEGDDPTQATVEVTIQMESMQADGSPRLLAHLKSDDFLDVVNHPTARFRSTRITAGGEGDATHTVAGELTIRGQTHPVSFPATVAVTATEITARGEMVFDRRPFGIDYDGMADNLIEDEVKVRLDVRAAR